MKLIDKKIIDESIFQELTDTVHKSIDNFIPYLLVSFVSLILVLIPYLLLFPISSLRTKSAIYLKKYTKNVAYCLLRYASRRGVHNACFYDTL